VQVRLARICAFADSLSLCLCSTPTYPTTVTPKSIRTASYTASSTFSCGFGCSLCALAPWLPVCAKLPLFVSLTSNTLHLFTPTLPCTLPAHICSRIVVRHIVNASTSSAASAASSVTSLVSSTACESSPTKLCLPFSLVDTRLVLVSSLHDSTPCNLTRHLLTPHASLAVIFACSPSHLVMSHGTTSCSLHIAATVLLWFELHADVFTPQRSLRMLHCGSQELPTSPPSSRQWMSSRRCSRTKPRTSPSAPPLLLHSTWPATPSIDTIRLQTRQRHIALQWVRSCTRSGFVCALTRFTVLHPHFKLDYFRQHGWERDWVETARDLVQDELDARYKVVPMVEAMVPVQGKVRGVRAPLVIPACVADSWACSCRSPLTPSHGLPHFQLQTRPSTTSLAATWQRRSRSAQRLTQHRQVTPYSGGTPKAGSGTWPLSLWHSTICRYLVSCARQLVVHS